MVPVFLGGSLGGACGQKKADATWESVWAINEFLLTGESFGSGPYNKHSPGRGYQQVSERDKAFSERFVVLITRMSQFVVAGLPSARDIEPDVDPLEPRPIEVFEGSDDEHTVDEEDEVAEPESKVWVMRDRCWCECILLLG